MSNFRRLYNGGHRRYYKIPPMELGAKKYHLTSQFFPESREPVLKWIYQHGLKKNELIHLIESAAKSRGKSNPSNEDNRQEEKS